MKKILASIILLLVFYNANAQNSYLQQVPYRGAFAAAPASPWTAGWTNFDPQNKVYGDANVTVSSIAGDTIKVNTTWTNNNIYLLRGVVYVKDGATLTIQPGTIIRGDDQVANSCLVVTRGSKIVAEGTASRPIVFTSNKAVGARARGNWGGLIILGKATNNITASATGSTATGTAGLMQIEGLATTAINRHGAGDAIAASADDNDSSGVLKFVRVEFPGYVFSANNEINGITFGSVGRKTVVDYVQVSYSDDDAYEWFGGTMNISHTVAFATRDDDFDTDYGYNGSQQFGLVVRDPDMADASRSNAFESDNEAGGATRFTGIFSPKTNPQVSNFTVIGPWRNNKVATPGVNVNYFAATELKRNPEIDIANSIMIGFQVGIGYQDSISLARFKDSTSRLRHNIVAGTNTNRAATNAILWKAGSATTLRTSYDSTSTDSTKRHFYRSYSTNGAVDADSSFFTIMKNERFDSRHGILVNALDSSYVRSDYRPYTGSPALSRYDYSTGASDFTISSADRLCTVTLGSVGVIFRSGATDTTATYSVNAVSGATTYAWAVPAGYTIISGQGTNSISVSIVRGSTGIVTVVPGALCTTSGSYTYGNVATFECPPARAVISAPALTINRANLCNIIGVNTFATVNATTPVGATQWVWTLPVGVLDSATNSNGEIVTSVPRLTIKLTSSFVANSNISARVLNACGDASITKTLALKASAPTKGVIKSWNGTAEIAPIIDACSAFGDRSELTSANALQYTIRRDSLLVSDTAYTWTVSDATKMIIQGNANDSSVLVKFSNTFTVGTLTITKESGCGSISTSLTIKKLLPAKPGRLITKRNNSTPSPFLNVCDVIGQDEFVRYQVPATPLLSTGYIWDRDSTTKMQIVGGGTSSDNYIDIKYLAGFTKGTVKVKSINTCGESAELLTLVKATPPAFPALTTITGATNGGALCGSTIVLRPSVLGQDSTTVDYVWVLPTGLTPNNARISTTSLGAVTGGTKYVTAADSIAIDWVSAKTAKISVAPRGYCEEGKAISVTLNSTPAQPASIGAFRYLPDPRPADSTWDFVTDVVPGATKYIWKLPAGLSFVTNDSTTTVRVRKSGNPLGTGLVSVTAKNNCAIGIAKTTPFSDLRGTTDVVNGEISTGYTNDESIISSNGSIKLTPNPNKGQFVLTVKSTNTVDKASIQIFDAYGRLVSTRFVNNSNGIITTSINDGNLISGTYNVRCTIGSETKTAPMVVQK